MTDQERDDWIELAHQHDYQTIAGLLRVPGGMIRAEEDEGFQDQLIGTTCRECNGAVAKLVHGYAWRMYLETSAWLDPWISGEAPSRPAAAIAMLKKFREGE